MSDLLTAEQKLQTEVDMYEYMVLKPLSMIDLLLREEHFAAAQRGMEQVMKNAADFSARLVELLPKPSAEEAAAPEEKK